MSIITLHVKGTHWITQVFYQMMLEQLDTLSQKNKIHELWNWKNNCIICRYDCVYKRMKLFIKLFRINK